MLGRWNGEVHFYVLKANHYFKSMMIFVYTQPYNWLLDKIKILPFDEPPSNTSPPWYIIPTYILVFSSQKKTKKLNSLFSRFGFWIFISPQKWQINRLRYYLYTKGRKLFERISWLWFLSQNALRLKWVGI